MSEVSPDPTSPVKRSLPIPLSLRDEDSAWRVSHISHETISARSTMANPFFITETTTATTNHVKC